jgi:hypothetical protein
VNLTIAVAVLVLIAAWALGAAIANLTRRRFGKAVPNVVLGVLAVSVAVSIVSVGMALRSYTVFTREELVAVVETRVLGPQTFEVRLTRVAGGRAGRTELYVMSGDQWAVDAVVLKWAPWMNLLGFHTAYRLDRLSGRYLLVSDELVRPRSVFALGEEGAPFLDLLETARAISPVLPVVDAVYGSSTFLPAGDGQRTDILVTTSGLIARPRNTPPR